MKSSTLPSLRVDPALRDAAEAVLREGESLSAFVEQSVRTQIAMRQSQADFIARGLASRDRAARMQRYVPADAVMQGLADRLAKRKRADSR